MRPSAEKAPKRPKKPSKTSAKDSVPQKDGEPLPEPSKPRRRSVLTRSQRRRQCLSISVSDEEEDLLRETAAAANMSFSAWARKHLFKAAGRAIPKRPA